MRVTLRKSGNSVSVRLPASVMQAAKLHLGQTVEVREEAGRVVIEPVANLEYDIEAMMAGITDENRHALIDAGKPAGAETW